MGGQAAVLRVGGALLAVLGILVAGIGALLVMALTGQALPADQLGDWVNTVFPTLVAGAPRPEPGALVAGLGQSRPGVWSLVLIALGAFMVMLGLVQVVTGRRNRVAMGLAVILPIAFAAMALTLD